MQLLIYLKLLNFYLYKYFYVQNEKEFRNFCACSYSLSISYLQSNQNQQATSDARLLISYTTSTTRTTSVNSFCSDKSRSNLIYSSQASAYSMYSSQMDSMFTLDGNIFTNNLLSGNSQNSNAMLQQNALSIALFVGPFALGLLLILVIPPFLCCCCTCPHKCPTERCRKNEQQQYTKFQLLWPVFVLIISLLLCIGACSAGYSQSQIISDSFDSMICASSIIIDDLLNGNVTVDGSSFFTGLIQLNTQLRHLNGNLTAINTTMANIAVNSTNMSVLQKDTTNSLANIAKIPKNLNSGGNMSPITYKTPFNAQNSTGNITSIFPEILGSSTTGGFVGELYSSVSDAKSSLTNISQSATNFINEASNFQNGISALQSTITNFTNFLSNAENGSYAFLNKIVNLKPITSLTIKLVYGIGIGVASLMLLSTLFVAFCDQTNCRYLMYFSCFILFFVGIGGFFMAILFSIISPTVYFGCQFIDFSLSSSANFNSSFQNLIPDSNYRSYITQCLPNSNGNLIFSFGGLSANAINNLSYTLTTMNSFNVSYQSSIILSALAQTTSYISNYQTGVILDIVDNSSISILNNLSYPRNYATCAASGFTSDSWVPSNYQNPTYIDCQILNGNLSTCSGGISSKTGTCNSCMDTTVVLNGYTSKTTLLSDLGKRYPGCTKFNDDLSNIWSNYYNIKKVAYAPIVTRGTAATNSVNTLITDMTGRLNTTFINTQNSLKNISATVSDPIYGLVAGLNCKVIGEDIQRAAATFCQSVFTIAYFTRLVMGLASFGILFSLCFGVCTGVRFYKQDMRQLNIVDNQVISDGDVDDITNNNLIQVKIIE